MRPHLRTTLAVLLAVIGLAVAGPVSAASAQTSGPESFTGFLIATGVSGERVVLATNIRARGVFNGSGKIVELPAQPGDLGNMNRDDLVFRQGTLHLFSFVQDFQIVSFDPNSCRFAVVVIQTTQFAGGTGIFAGRAATAPAGSMAPAWRSATRTAAATSTCRPRMSATRSPVQAPSRSDAPVTGRHDAHEKEVIQC